MKKIFKVITSIILQVILLTSCTISVPNNNLQTQSFNVDNQDIPSNLQGYKDSIEELHDDFLSLVNSENTYGLTESGSVIADESNLYSKLVKGYINGKLTPIEEVEASPDETPAEEGVEETPSRLSKLTKPIHQLMLESL